MERILVVEDDPALLRGLTDNLRCESYDVVTATDGLAAFQMIRTAQPDLVVLDLTLPGLDGLEVCRRVRELGLRTPIVMLTSRSEEGDRVHGLEMGADDYVSKPFSLPELFARIRSILRHRRSWQTETNELRRDLRSASDVQRALFPRVKPAVGGVDFAGACVPARIVGGDYYDYFQVDGAGLALMVADVAGKGASAALLMANLQGAVRSSAPAHGADCVRLADRLNEVMYAATDAARYVTVFYSVLDPSTGALTYVNAGHVAALVVADDGPPIELESIAPPIGLFEALPLTSRQLTVDRGAWVLMFSDGIPEAVDAGDREFGRDRIVDVVRRHRHATAAELCDALLQGVIAHTGDGAQSDDLTVVAARRT